MLSLVGVGSSQQKPTITGRKTLSINLRNQVISQELASNSKSKGVEFGEEGGMELSDEGILRLGDFSQKKFFLDFVVISLEKKGMILTLARVDSSQQKPTTIGRRILSPSRVMGKNMPLT